MRCPNHFMRKELIIIYIAIIISALIITSAVLASRYTWKIYRNKEHQFEIRYPRTWTFEKVYPWRFRFSSPNYQTKESAEYKAMMEKGEDPLLVPPVVISSGALIKFDISNLIYDTNFKGWRGIANEPSDYIGKLIDEDFIKIDGKEVFRREWEYKEAIFIEVGFPDPQEKKIFALSILTLNSEKEKNLQIFNKIISSFKFLR